MTEIAGALPSAREQDLADLFQRKAHALLLEAPPAQGQFELALALAQSWLCEQSTELKSQHKRFCGQCEACHLFSRMSHPDVCVLVPETLMLEMGWHLGEKVQDEIDKKKRKPSKEIRIDAMHAAIEFSQRTASRAQGKVVVIFPAQAMNHATANALLKTLEEPPSGLRFILATDAPHHILATIRSRCQSYRLSWADLSAQREPLANDLPHKLFQGDVQAFLDFTPARVVELCLQICHDAWMLRIGAPLRFFSPEQMPSPITYHALGDWYTMLMDLAKTAQHPYKPELFIENLVAQSSLFLKMTSQP